MYRNTGKLVLLVSQAMRAAIAVAVLVLAGCGSTAPLDAPTQPQAAVPREASLPKKLRADLRAIRAEAARVPHSLMGTPALQDAAGAFLDDLARSKLPAGVQNRAIDHAASAVAGSCDQCFQMLEADRPIPAIAHPSH